MGKFSSIFLCLLLWCSLGIAQAPAGDTVMITGAATILQGLALPSSTMLVVEVKMPSYQHIVAEQRVRLDGRQPPMRFSFEAPEVDLDGAMLRAAFLLEGQTSFVSDAIPLHVTGNRHDVGEIILHPYRPLAFATELICEGRPARFGMEGDTPTIEIDDQRHHLQEDDPSGSRLIGTDAPIVFEWRDDRGVLHFPDGSRLTCIAAAERAERRLRCTAVHSSDVAISRCLDSAKW